jgi:ankyrin repeat protein
MNTTICNEKYRENSLIEGVKNGDLYQINCLLENINNINNINNVDKYGWNALMYACRRGYKEIVNYLLDKGAFIYIRDNDKWNVLMIASLSYQKEIIDILLDYELLKFGDKFINCNYKCGCLLINNRDVYGRNILMYACKDTNLDFIDFLLKKNIDINEKDINGYTALMFACSRGNIDVIKLLLTYNASIDIKNYEGETPLMISAQRGYIDIIKLLLDNNAILDDRDNKGMTVLTHSIGHINIIKLLLKFSMLINIVDNDGYTSLMHIAINSIGLKSNNSIDIIKLLLDNGCLINKQDINGYTALMHACVNNNDPYIIKLLLENGANPNIKEYYYGNNALLCIINKMNVIYINIENINLLLVYGINIYEKNKSGRTIFDIDINKLKNTKNIIQKWPFSSLIILLKELMVYHILDASTLIDLREFSYEI